MHQSVRPAHGVLLSALLALLIPVTSILVLDRLGGALTAVATAVATAIGFGVAGIGSAVAWRRGGYALQWSRGNAAELALLAATLLGSFGYLLWLAGWPFLPVGTSVDGAWHYGLVDHITQVRRLGVPHVRVSDVDSYTPGYHLLALGLAQWLDTPPIYTVYPASAAMVALAISATVQTAMDAAPPGAGRLAVGGGALALLALLPQTATIEIITAQNFYPTAAGLAYLLAAGWAAALRHRTDRRITWLPLGAALLGVILCYPFWLPSALALVVALSVARYWGDWRALGATLVALAAIVGGSLLLVHDLMDDQIRQITNRMPSLGLAELALLAALAIGGMALSRLLRRQRALPLAILAGLSLAQVILLGGEGTYVGQKLLYGVPYTTVAACGALAGLAFQLTRRPLARQALLAALVIGAAGAGTAAIAQGKLAQRPFHPLSPDQADLALWVRDHIQPDPDSVEYVVEYSITAYWIKVGVLRSVRGWSATSVLEYPVARYDYWVTDPALSRFAFVDNTEPPQTGSPAQERARRGAARFLERVDAAPAGQVEIKAYTTPERFGTTQTVRTSAYVSGLPDDKYRLWFLLTPGAEDDRLPPPLWRQPLDSRAWGASRYGLVRVDPQIPEVSVWADGKPVGVAVPPLPTGTHVSGWMQLTYDDQPIATRRIYDLTIGDASTLRMRDFNPTSVFAWSPQPLAGAEPSHAIRAELGGRLAIEGWELDREWLQGGASSTLVLAWRGVAPVAPPARIFVHLLGADGSSYPVYDGEPREGRYPFWLWQPGAAVRDQATLTLPASIPAGRYELVVGVYNPATGAALPVSAGPATAREPAVLLGEVEVRSAP